MMKMLFAKKEKQPLNQTNAYPRKRMLSLSEIEDFFIEKEEKLKGIQITFQFKKKV